MGAAHRKSIVRQTIERFDGLMAIGPVGVILTEKYCVPYNYA